MKFKELGIKGLFLITLDKMEDERGFFSRSFCVEEFKEKGINFSVEQCNVSFNKKKGTLRGMHYQSGKYAEAKIVRCVKGKIFDVVIDVRKDSPTYLSWEAICLEASQYDLLYIPEGCAHGFQTLQDNTELFYMMNNSYCPESSKGIKWNDATFKIKWPDMNPVVSTKDNEYPEFIA